MKIQNHRTRLKWKFLRELMFPGKIKNCIEILWMSSVQWCMFLSISFKGRLWAGKSDSGSKYRFSTFGITTSTDYLSLISSTCHWRNFVVNVQKWLLKRPRTTSFSQSPHYICMIFSGQYLRPQVTGMHHFGLVRTTNSCSTHLKRSVIGRNIIETVECLCLYTIEVLYS